MCVCVRVCVRVCMCVFVADGGLEDSTRCCMGTRAQFGHRHTVHTPINTHILGGVESPSLAPHLGTGQSTDALERSWILVENSSQWVHVLSKGDYTR